MDSVLPKYWRVVASASRLPQSSPSEQEPEANQDIETYAFLLEVDPSTTPYTSRLPKIFQQRFAESQLRTVPECIRPPFMGALGDKSHESTLPSEAKVSRDIRYSKIEALVSSANLSKLLRKDTRADLLEDHAGKVGASVNKLRKLLTKYWWFGCDENALLELQPLKGGPGKQRLSTVQGKRGARNAVAKDDPTSALRGINYDEKHRAKFVRALHLYWIGQGMSLAETWTKMTETEYRTLCTGKDGRTFWRTTPPKQNSHPQGLLSPRTPIDCRTWPSRWRSWSTRLRYQGSIKVGDG